MRCATRFCKWAIFVTLLSCSTSSSQKKKNSVDTADEASSEESSEANSKSKAPEKQEKKEEKSSVSGTSQFVVTTLNNENVVQGSVTSSLVSDAIIDFDELTRKDPENVNLLTTYLSLLRLRGQGADIYKNIGTKAGGVGSKNPWFLIEASYGAITRREYALAEYLLAKAERNSAGNPLIKAATEHAYGIRYLVDKKIQHGVAEMRKAAQANYMPALLTLGFLALRSGDYVGAEKTFRAAAASDNGNLNARIGLSVALRTRGKAEEAAPLMATVFNARPQDRRVAWNYALALSEVPAMKKKATEVLNQYFQMPGTLGDIDGRANALMTKLNSQSVGVEGSKPAAGESTKPTAAVPTEK